MQDLNDLTEDVIGAAIEVLKELGPGLLESTYEECLSFELQKEGYSVEYQKDLPVMYKGNKIECGYRIDMLVENQVIIELKAVEQLKNIHKAQLLTYLKLTEAEVGLLMNFNVEMMKDGIKRFRL